MNSDATSGPLEAIDYSIEFNVDSDSSIAFSASVPSADHYDSYLAFNFSSDADEEIYGLGLQYTVWDFKGHEVPLFTREGGVGRGL